MKKVLTIISILIITAGLAYSATRFADNGDGTVTDNGTGLIWQKCSAGLSGTDCSSGTASSYTWEGALSFCEGLSQGGRSDWRLPSINELKSIVDYGNYNPAINTSWFPGTVSSDYWSSTTGVGSTTYAWRVYFSYGNVGSVDKTGNYYVRCVSGP